MTERIIWICDGCDKELVRLAHQPSDWKPYNVTLDNAAGYPICNADGMIHVAAHLCPSCAKHLADIINPRRWVRFAEPKRTPTETTGED